MVFKSVASILNLCNNLNQMMMLREKNPTMTIQPNRLSFIRPKYHKSGNLHHNFLVISGPMRRSLQHQLFSASLASIHDERKPMKGNHGSSLVNDFPENVYPTYRPIPLKVKALLALLSSMWATTTGKIGSELMNHSTRDIGILFRLMLRFCVTLLLLTAATQDLFFSPTRLDTATIIEKRLFPSIFSNFSRIQATIVPEMLGLECDCVKMQDIGVHFIEYDKIGTAENKFDVLHFNHGFGASSLSWLPVIPSLVERLRGKKGIAHDSPGFGFTDRRGKDGVMDLIPFSSAGSAALGLSLLKQQLKSQGNFSDPFNRVALFGHSMGCAITLKMALALPQNIKVDVILVAPALVGDFPTEGKGTNAIKPPLSILKRQPVYVSRFITLVRQVIFDPVLRYILKRAVGTRGFWKKGLREVWGKPDLLTDTDILRFQWPSVGKEWESGLLAFSRSRLKSTCNYEGGEIKLLFDVIKRPNTSVTIIHGTNDKVVPIHLSEAIVSQCADIELIRMEGYGHDPFEEGEEGVKEFCDVVVRRLDYD